MEPSYFNNFLELMKEFGVNSALLVALIFWVLKENKLREETMAKNHKEDKNKWIEISEKHLEILSTNVTLLTQQIVAHDARAAAGIKSIEEANKYQRDEHEKMTLCLQSISQNLAVIGKIYDLNSGHQLK